MAIVFYFLALLLAFGAVMSGFGAMFVPSYRRGADMLQAAAWMRAGALFGGGMVAVFAGYVCQKLDEIALALRPDGLVETALDLGTKTTGPLSEVSLGTGEFVGAHRKDLF